jgi:hypothetical protein
LPSAISPQISSLPDLHPDGNGYDASVIRKLAYQVALNRVHAQKLSFTHKATGMMQCESMDSSSFVALPFRYFASLPRGHPFFGAFDDDDQTAFTW